MMPSFDFALDTDVRYGVGTSSELGNVVARIGRTAALVTGAGFDKRPYRDQLVDSLAAAGVAIVARIVTGNEPRSEQVSSAAQQVKSSAADVVIAIGGGSALDLGKAAAVVAGGAELGTLLSGATVGLGTGIPVVAVPTTAGTGSEVSRGAIVLDDQAARKRGLRGRGVAPRVAVVDPRLVLSAGAETTAASGYDAMAHAIETAVSRASGPINMLFSAEAIRLLLSAIPAALERPDDLPARSDASYASLLMGFNLATASTCLPHRLQYPVGALTGTSHPRGVAALMPAWLRRTLTYAPDRLAELARRSGVAGAGSVRGDAKRLVDLVDDWTDRIGMRTSLIQLGVARPTIARLVPMVEGTLQNDPGPVSPADLEELLRQSL